MQIFCPSSLFFCQPNPCLNSEKKALMISIHGDVIFVGFLCILVNIHLLQVGVLFIFHVCVLVRRNAHALIFQIVILTIHRRLATLSWRILCCGLPSTWLLGLTSVLLSQWGIGSATLSRLLAGSLLTWWLVRSCSCLFLCVKLHQLSLTLCSCCWFFIFSLWIFHCFLYTVISLQLTISIRLKIIFTKRCSDTAIWKESIWLIYASLLTASICRCRLHTSA